MKKKRPDPYLIDDDNPELTDEFFKNARPGIEVLEEQFGKAAVEKFLKNRGRPKKDKTKVLTSLRFDSEVIEQFRAMGKGWQSRINQALKEWLVEHHS